MGGGRRGREGGIFLPSEICSTRPIPPGFVEIMIRCDQEVAVSKWFLSCMPSTFALKINPARVQCNTNFMLNTYVRIMRWYS